MKIEKQKDKSVVYIPLVNGYIIPILGCSKTKMLGLQAQQEFDFLLSAANLQIVGKKLILSFDGEEFRACITYQGE